VRANKSVLIHEMRQPKPRKPSISDIKAAGSLLGLDENDVRGVYQVSKASKLKQFLTHSFLLFLFSLLAVIIVALILSKILYGRPPGGVVPMYAVSGKEWIKARIFPF
jgi:hypothetical protein